MKIGIIGAGPIGATLARKFSQAGHAVKIANSRGPETLEVIAAETGATAANASDAVKDVDVVIISIPMKGIEHLSTNLFDGVPDGVVVIDTNNYYPARDGQIDEIDQGKIESRWVSDRIGRPVIKAFNNILSYVLASGAKPSGAVDRIATPVAGDDAKAKAVVLELVDVAGFDGIDAGGLDDSWRQQPCTPVYCTDYDAEGVREALIRADRGRAPKNRDIVWAKVLQIPADTEPREFAGLIRTLSRSINNQVE
jgi:predicted dinucleotide-binding enzyme